MLSNTNNSVYYYSFAFSNTFFKFHEIFKIVRRLYIYIYIYRLVGCVLWHVNSCRLLNVKSYIFIYIVIYRAIGIMSRVFANGPGDRGSILGRVIPKTQKWYLMPPCWVKWSNSGNGVAPSSTPQCSSYWKGSLQVSIE